MSQYEDDPQEVAYYADPEGVTARIVAEAAATAAAEVAMFNDSRRDAELARVRQGQVESAALTAKDALDQKYGKESVDRLLPKISERIAASPHLVPEELLTSPTGLAHAIEDVYRLAKVDADAEDEAKTWENIKNANSNIPRVSR